MTAAAFRPDPDRPGTRIFSTGDLGVMLPDGCLVYKGEEISGRKFTGFEWRSRDRGRIAKAPLRRSSRGGSPSGAAGEDRLVAYVVLKREALITVNDLRGVSIRDVAGLRSLRPLCSSMPCRSQCVEKSIARLFRRRATPGRCFEPSLPLHEISWSEILPSCASRFSESVLSGRKTISSIWASILLRFCDWLRRYRIGWGRTCRPRGSSARPRSRSWRRFCAMVNVPTPGRRSCRFTNRAPSLRSSGFIPISAPLLSRYLGQINHCMD
jgi:hypothetical protein